MLPQRPTKIRRTEGLNASNATRITSGRELSSAMADYNGEGIRSFKDFLNRCSKGAEVEEAEAAVNRAILKEYLEAQCRNAAAEKNDDTEKELGVFNDVAQIWSYASQNNLITLLSLVPSSMTILIRLCSYHEDFRAYGTTLIKSLLQPSTLKIVYRSLTGNKDQVVSPCLRMLTEINRFNFGALCGLAHSSFDFTVKDLPRNLEVKGTKSIEEDPARPSVRTVFVRFFLSFLQNGEPSVRNEMLGLRSWITPLFKHLKTDTASTIYDLLRCMATKVLAEKEIPRATKTNAFNEWILAHILSLYSRRDIVKFFKDGKEEEEPLADVVHGFLLEVCTQKGSGICFPDSGWYPPRHSEHEEKRRTVPKVYNRILSSVLTHTRPFADTLQLDLILEILKTSPELVADYFLSKSAFSFEPKLTSTWIGYCAFLMSVITLPIPANFGAPGAMALPPPNNVVIENIIPKPLNKAVMTKCLAHENSLIRFFSTRLLIAAFRKLRSVLDALETASSAMHDPAETWKKCKFEVVEEFCKRIPDVSVVSSGAAKVSASGVLQTEAKMRLLAYYYITIPEVALSGNFDLNIALSTFLGREEEQNGMQLLEMGHMLKIASEVPDVKWWNKTPAMKHSPFVVILKLCCNSATNAPNQQVRALLHSFASTSYLFQAETAASPLDALLEALSVIEGKGNLEAILSFLDEVVARCVRGPFKYLDEYAEIATEVRMQKSEANNLPPVSPIVMALAEQWKFFIRSEGNSIPQKACGVKWLLRLLQSCAFLGENRYVLAVLVGRLMADSKDTKEGFMELKDYLENGQGLGLAPEHMRDDTAVIGIRDLFAALPERSLDPHLVPVLSQSVLHNRIEASIFDLAVVQRAIGEITESGKFVAADAAATVAELDGLMKNIAFQLVSKGDKTTEMTKSFLVKEGCCLRLFCSTSTPTDRIPLVVELSHAYAGLLSVIFQKDDPILDTARNGIIGNMLEFLKAFEALSEDEIPKLLTVYRSMISLLYTPQDVKCLIGRLLSMPSLSKNGALPQLLGFMLHLSVERGDVLPVDFINRLLKLDFMATRVSSALIAYILGTEAKDLQGVDYPKTTVPEQTAVVCSLILKLPAMGKIALKQLDKEVRAGSTMPLLIERVSALLEVHSVIIGESSTFAWTPSASAAIKARLQNAFEFIQKELLQATPDATKVNVLRRAASLFPSLDRRGVLKHIAGNRKRSTLTDNTVALLDALVRNFDDASTPEMKGWFLMVFDHLTRRFSEDTVLSSKLTALAKAFGKFLARSEINLGGVIPRAALNAVLEAGLQKHISIPEVAYFAVNAVSRSSPKSLDLAKLLQIVLGHNKNPLSSRDTIFEAEDTHHYIAFLIQKLFEAGKTSLCNIATLDGVMVLYRGTDDPIDRMLLDIIQKIEGHLARSCAGRISSWSVLESTDKPLVSRVRGRLEVSINTKILAKSVFHTVPSIPNFELVSLDTFLSAVKDNTVPVGKAYDPMFMLPALTFCLVSDSNLLEAPAAIDRHCISYAIATLSSTSKTIRQMSTAFLTAAASKLEGSSYRGKTQLTHLLLSILASLSSQPDEPLPTATSIFLAQVIQVLSNPTHFLYEKTMDLLLRHPLLQLHDLPLMLSPLQVGDGSHHREVAWILNILTAGLKTHYDLLLYRKRNVFGNVLTLYGSPNTTERAREKVLELLWNAAAVEGGATTLLTRNGVIAWIEQQLGVSKEADLTLKRLAARLWEGAAKAHVTEWSRGNLGAHYVGERARLGVGA